MAFSFFNENGRILVEIMDDFSPPLSSSSSSSLLFTDDDSNHSESESIDIVEDRLIEITINDDDNDDDQNKEIMYIEIDEPDYKQFNTFRMRYRLFLLVEMGRDLDVPTDVYHYIISVCSLFLYLCLCISQFYSVCLYVVIVKLFYRIIRLVIVQSVRYSMVIKISCVSSAVTDEPMTVIVACIVRIIKLSYV